jgi:hypothetical protein
MRTTKISILIPSNRDNFHTIGALLQLAVFDENKYEIIVRDNSESNIKFDILKKISHSNINIVFSKHCEGEENFYELFRLASGEFVLFLGDDDRLFWDGLNSIYDEISKVASSEKRIYSGAYLITGGNRDFIYNYTDLDSQDTNLRIINFTKSKSNYIFYSVIEKGLYTEMFSFLKSMPCLFLYSDQILTLFLLCRSNVFVSDRILINYDYSEWNTTEKAISKDRSYYLKNGLDPEIDQLHILLQAIEGYLFLKSKLNYNCGLNNLDTSANFWFNSKYNSFLKNTRSISTVNDTHKACNKLKLKLSNLKSIDVNELLNHICEVMSISNIKVSEKYFNFWSKI